MTIAATAATDFAVDDLVKIAYALNGFGPHEPTSGDLLLGRQVLGLGLQSLANDGIVLRARERLSLTLVAGQAYVDCPSDTLSIESGGVIRNTSGAEVAIDPIAIQQYQSLAVKTTQGMPSQYFPEQQSGGSWRIYFWPVPTSDFPTFVVPRTRRSRDVTTGNVTVDFDPKWHLAIVKFLQANIARAKGRRDIGTEMMTEYREERERASNNETDRGDGMVLIDESPWG